MRAIACFSGGTTIEMFVSEKTKQHDWLQTKGSRMLRDPEQPDKSWQTGIETAD